MATWKYETFQLSQKNNAKTSGKNMNTTPKAEIQTA